MDIKPIETEYNGYRFRSRLEARWAVFFDKADIEYQYEPEGFQLDDGTKYLPDFYLPQMKLYVEIKPEKSLEAELRYSQRAICFVKSTGNVMVLCCGDPYEPDIYIYTYFQGEVVGRYGVFTVIQGEPFIVVQYNQIERYTNKDGQDVGIITTRTLLELLKDKYCSSLYRTLKGTSLRTARLAGRMARFEYGEKG